MQEVITGFLSDVPVLSFQLYGASVAAWIGAVLLAVICSCIIRGMLSMLARRVRRLMTFINTDFTTILAELLENTNLVVIIVGSSLLAGEVVALPDALLRGLRMVFTISVLIQIGMWGSRVVAVLIEHHLKTADQPAAKSALGLVSFGGKVVVWSAISLLILENLGIDITALVAGLGVGGVAVALAVQNILGDVFGSLSIVLDKPFEVGDFVVVGDFLGTVERIGIKTTRIKSLSGEQIVFSNSDLLSSRIRNYKRMYERRVLFSLGVTYQTSYEKLKLIPTIIREIIESQSQTRFDRAHFARYAASSLDFEIVYYVISSDYTLYMNIQQAINLSIFERFEAEGIEFAYPTQTIFLQNSSGGES